jgi:quinol monooxygenase YgiN
MSVVVVATLTPLPEHRDTVRTAIISSVGDVHREEGCELYAVHESSDSFIFIEQWSDQAALDLHNTGAALRGIQGAIEGKLAQPVSVVLATALPAGMPHKGTLT